MSHTPRVREDFFAWARLSAMILRRPFQVRVRVLGSHGVVGDWQAADTRWYDELRADVVRGDLERVEAYAELCAEAVLMPDVDGDTATSPLPPVLRPVDPPMGIAPATWMPPRPPPAPRTAAPVPPLPQASAPRPRTPPAPLAPRPAAPPDLADATVTSTVQPVFDSFDEGPTAYKPRPGYARAALTDDEATKVDPLRFTLEQYAVLRAELALRPDRADASWSARGVHGVAARAEVEGAWAVRLGQEPHLKRELDELVRRAMAERKTRPAGHD